MAIDFPNSPSINDVHSDGLASWTWTGYAWKRIPDPGAKGQKGDPGPQGIQGLIGSQGDKGQKGDVLAKGVKGEEGQKGEKGDVLAKGVKGEVGDKGQKGEPGVSIKGEQGNKGIKGDAVKGDQGDKGDEGQKGDTGSGGEKGATGSLSTANVSNPSRSLGTDYQNTTGELMYVITTTLVPTWSNYTISKIGAATNSYAEVFLARDNGSANANNVWVTSVFWVPNNYYYRVDAFNHLDNNVNSTSTVRTWSELTFS